MKWKCTVCGYIHTGDSPPDRCPICGVGPEKFTKIEDQEAKNMPTWKCTKCGYQFEAETPPEKCPACGMQCTFTNVTCYIPECQDTGVDKRL